MIIHSSPKYLLVFSDQIKSKLLAWYKVALSNKTMIFFFLNVTSFLYFVLTVLGKQCNNIHIIRSVMFVLKEINKREYQHLQQFSWLPMNKATSMWQIQNSKLSFLMPKILHMIPFKIFHIFIFEKCSLVVIFYIFSVVN